jgi:L-2-hydroxyglutarate oxidase LhgO
MLVHQPPSKIISAAHKVDTIVIGAGVIGLAIARAITGKNTTQAQEILLIDRATNIGTETSSRNSEVIHGGLYYPHNSLKGKLCVKGRLLLYKYCDEHAVPYNRCGKLVVANTEQQLSVLRTLELQAVANGVYDTHIIPSQEKIRFDYDETEIVAKYGALVSPSTGIIDSHALMEQFRYDIENPPQNSSTNSVYASTAVIALRTNVIDGYIDMSKNVHDDPYNIYVGTETTRTKVGDSKNETETDSLMVNDKLWLSCRQLINCSGLWASEVANYFHTNDFIRLSKKQWTVPKQYFCRGTYYKVSSCATGDAIQPKFRHLIYPVPDPSGSGLGIHATIDLSEPQPQVKFGPDVEWLNPFTHPDDIDMEPKISPSQLQLVYDWIRTYWPQLQDNTLVPDYCGIRPKLLHPTIRGGQSSTSSSNHRTKAAFQDFMIAGPKEHGVPGLVHLFGMESPGLTCSMAIGNYVINLLSNSTKDKKHR